MSEKAARSHSPIPPPDLWRPEPALPSTMPVDWPCARCAYNLRGLSVGGRCPECGHSIRETVIAPLARANPHVLHDLVNRSFMTELSAWLLLAGGGLVVSHALVGAGYAIPCIALLLWTAAIGLFFAGAVSLCIDPLFSRIIPRRRGTQYCMSMIFAAVAVLLFGLMVGSPTVVFAGVGCFMTCSFLVHRAIVAMIERSANRDAKPPLGSMLVAVTLAAVVGCALCAVAPFALRNFSRSPQLDFLMAALETATLSLIFLQIGLTILFYRGLRRHIHVLVPLSYLQDSFPVRSLEE